MIDSDFKAVKALRADADGAAPVGLAYGVQAQIHRRSQYSAFLVIRVVAGKLRPARRKKFFSHIPASFNIPTSPLLSR